MGKAKQILIQFWIIWLSVSSCTFLAVILRISKIDDIESIVIIGAIISGIQLLIGVKRRYSVTIIPLFLFIIQSWFLLPSANDDGLGFDVTMTFAEYVSPYFYALLLSIRDSFSWPIDMVLTVVNCTVLTSLYLFLELSFARYLLLNISKDDERE